MGVRKDDFVSLHNHSDRSLLDGFSTVEEYIERTVDLGQRGFGLTDHGNTFNVYSMLQTAKNAGIIGIPGSEFYVAPINPEGAKVQGPVFYGETYQGKNGRLAAVSPNDVSSSGGYLHLTVWAYNKVGLKNLFKLSSISNSPENFYKKGRIDFDMLANYSDGLIVSTGCPSSEISTRFLLNQDNKAYEYASLLKEVFGKERLFVEVMDHSMSIDLEKKLLPKQIELAKALDLNLLATNDCHYAHNHDDVAHEELLCIQSGAKMSDDTYDQGGRRFAFNGREYYMKSASQMLELFPQNDFPNAVSNSLLIAEMTEDLSFDYDPHLKPIFPLPEGFKDEITYYKHLLQEGFKKRYGNSSPEIKKEAAKKLKEELHVIQSSDFVGYMLVVRDYLMWTKKNHSVYHNNELIASANGPGRGSVGSSISAYVLEISETCPIKHGLIFERFLSAGRGAVYEITYDDGTTETLVASDEKILSDGKPKYTHKLEIGDEVL